jgi:hypothetical protein
MDWSDSTLDTLVGRQGKRHGSRAKLEENQSESGRWHRKGFRSPTNLIDYIRAGIKIVDF